MSIGSLFGADMDRKIGIFNWIFAVLIISLLTSLGYHQLIESQNYQLLEEQQAQRRILTPGSRGDVYDREGRLLVGNLPRFSAVLYLDDLQQEFKTTYYLMVHRARKVKADIGPESSIESIIRSIAPAGTRGSGFIEITGGADPGTSRIVRWQNNRQLAKADAKGVWRASFDQFDADRRATLEIPKSNGGKINIKVAEFYEIKAILSPEGNWGVPANETMRINGNILRWKSRLAVVRKYVNEVNRITGRNNSITMLSFRNHFNKRLLLPLRIAHDIDNKEYAKLIENLPVDSPVQVLTEARRYYPFNGAASHLLGYVGGEREIKGDPIPGKKMSTVRFKEKIGADGIEKYFDEHLRGKHGSEIWHVDPIGYQYERIKHRAPSKGKSLYLSLDISLQKTAEDALSEEIGRITSRRRGSDKNWLEVIRKKTVEVFKETDSMNETAALRLIDLLGRSHRPQEAKELCESLGFPITAEKLVDLLNPLVRNGFLKKSSVANNQIRYSIPPPPPPPGAVVLLDVKTGEVLAMASKPNYDLNELSPRITNQTWNSILAKGAFLPRAIHPGYPPASTYKLLTAVTAMRSGKIEPDYNGTCEGQYKQMGCWINPGRHGVKNLVSALADSCNIYFYRLGEMVGHDALIAESKRFGMHLSTGIQLPRVGKPLVPDPDWKKRKIGEGWKLEDTLNVSIGQGGFKLSPLQVACFVASLARGETRTIPTLLRQEEGKPPPDHGGEPIGLQPDQYNAILAGMNKSATDGTGWRCKVPGVQLASKTGTGQWRNNNMQLHVAWFVSFAPLDNPEVAIAVLVEGTVPQDEVQGGLNAAPIAQKVLRKYFEQGQSQ